MATTTTSLTGRDLRGARERAGLTRAQLANLAGCSLAALGNIEQGAVPKRSRVLDAAFEAIAAHDSSTSEAAGANRGSATLADAGDGHGRE